MSAISISGLHKHYPGVHALKGIDLNIERGEFFGLLGPNGAGKSTLINIIAGLTRFRQGQVMVLGNSVVSEYQRTRCQLGMVPQELTFDPFSTCAKFCVSNRVIFLWDVKTIRGSMNSWMR